MRVFERGWWIPLAEKKPERGFRWKEQQLSKDECYERYVSGKALGLRPASLGLVCVDVDREGGQENLARLALEAAASYPTSKPYKRHLFFPYEGEPFAFRHWKYGEVFHENYVWVRDAARVHWADELREYASTLDVAQLPGLGRVATDENGAGLRSIIPRFTPEQAAEGRREAAFNRSVASIGRAIDAERLLNEGYTKAAIARELDISRTHVYRLLA